MSVVEEIKQRVDIVEIVGRYVPLAKAGRTFTGLCPFHSEKHPSFFVYPQQQSWHCFGSCNTGGDVFSFIMKKEGIGFGDALRLLAERTGVTIPTSPEGEADRKVRDRLYQANQAAAEYFHDLLSKPAAEPARRYLVGRGLTPETMTGFGLGFSLNSWDALKQHLLDRGYAEGELLTAGLVAEAEVGKTHDRFRNKIMFPIFDIRGGVTGFGARVLDDSLPKYINSPQTPLFDKSSSLYGINLAHPAIRQQDMVVIVEGYMDVIAAHQGGFSNVVAPMGTSLTDKQIAILKRLTRNVTLALDADAAGEDAMLKGVGYENAFGAEVKVMVLPAGKDPDDIIREDVELWRRGLEEAVPVIDYTFSHVVRELDLATARGKSLAGDRLLPVVAEIQDVVRRAHYLQKLEHLVKVNPGSLETTLRRIKSQTRRQPGEAKDSLLPPVYASPIEEYCLALLLQHPELKACANEMLPEYFESSENREIFLAYRETADIELKGKLDMVLWEHLDSLTSRGLPSGSADRKLADCILRLRERYLRNLETKKEAELALEAESRGKAAELAKLEERGIDVSVQLGQIFMQRGKGGGKGDEK